MSCHEDQAMAWSGSHHDLAMQEATQGTILGNFDSATYERSGVLSTFRVEDGRYIVSTIGPDGQPGDFEVAYTFGVFPLQQYLIAMPDGRYQAYNVAWDARPADQGGQRWFHLYPDVEITPSHPLHWSRDLQNWNRTCAACHSTNVQKGFDVATASYATTWSDIDVACESCHGPGSKHVAIAGEAGETGTADDWQIALSLDTSRSWSIRAGSTIAQRDNPRPNDEEIETCGDCHSRRARVARQREPGLPLLDEYVVSMLRDDLYYPDGQILDEVYEYGSFIQSRMYHAGVTCSDCHDPHSLRPREDGNALCGQCHLASTYDTASHHFHSQESSGSRCVECHMPTRTYMQVDPRRDHSLRIPRPDLSVKLGVPNACTTCHVDQTNEWASTVAGEWYGARNGETHYGEILSAGRRADPVAFDALGGLVSDTSVAPVVRATALTLMAGYRRDLNELHVALSDRHPLVRLGAARAMSAVADPTIRLLAVTLSRDSVRAVRVEAGRALSAVPSHLYPASDVAAIDSLLSEYESAQRINADFPASWINLGDLHANRGEFDAARSAYEQSIELDSTFLPGYLNLADFYRATDRDNLGETVLLEALDRFPEAAGLQHALGLLRIRQGDREEALGLLARASLGEPDNARFAYVYGVAQASAGDVPGGLRTLSASLERNAFDPDLLGALAAYHRQRGEFSSALRYAERLATVDPANDGVRRLVNELRSQTAR